MPTSNKKLSIALSILLFLAVLVIASFFPSTGLILSIGLLLCSVIVTSIAVIGKYRQANQRGGITRLVFIQNSFFEIMVVFIATTLAGLLGGLLARLATAPIPLELPRLLAGILVGVLVGAGVGWLAGRVRRGATRAVRRRSRPA